MLSAPLTSVCPSLCTLWTFCTWKIRLCPSFFVNTICTVKTPVMKNKNTFQKDQKMESKTQKSAFFLFFQFFHTHSIAHSYTTLERQQMSVLQGNNVFVANMTLTLQTTSLWFPPLQEWGKKIQLMRRLNIKWDTSISFPWVNTDEVTK